MLESIKKVNVIIYIQIFKKKLGTLNKHQLFHLLLSFRFIHALIEEFRTNGSRNDVLTILESVEDKILTKLESWREEENIEEVFIVKELTRTLYLNEMEPCD